jgi:hypothetical protein
MAKVCKSDGQGTFAGTQGNGEVAPKAAVRRVESNRRSRTDFGHSSFAGRCRGRGFLRVRTERDGFDRLRRLNA